jgi:hypothetical protein
MDGLQANSHQHGLDRDHSADDCCLDQHQQRGGPKLDNASNSLVPRSAGEKFALASRRLISAHPTAHH